MGKEDEKKKEKSDKDKDKKDKEKKEKSDKDKDKKDKEKKEKSDKDKDKKDKDKSDKKDKDDKDKKDKKEKDKFMPDQEWKIVISKNLDELIGAYGKIVKVFQDIDNYILKDSKTVEEFKEKIQKAIADLPEHHQSVFIAFLDTIQ